MHLIGTGERDVTGGKEGASSPSNSAPELTAFSNWLEDLEVDPTPETARRGDVQRGVALAIERAAIMRELIKNDPRAALAQSVSFAEYERLPQDVRAHVERPFSETAELLALPVCGPALRAGEIDYRLRIGSESYAASVVGRRAANDTKEGTPLHGITLGDVAAVGEGVFQVVPRKDAAMFPDGQLDARHCFATGAPLGADAVIALAGGRVFRFADGDALAEFDARAAALDRKPGPHTGSRTVLLMADAGEAGDGEAFDWPAAEDEAEAQASTWTETPKDVYFIRVDFPDNTGASIGQATLANTLNGTVSAKIAEMSYGKTELNANVSPIVVRMPSASGTYAPSNSGALHDDAKVAAEAQIPGLDLDDYDIIGVHFANIGMDYGGLAGGSRQWVQATGSSNLIIHEFGHNYGVGHASFWETSDGSVVGAGSNVEYGDDFDIMGNGPNDAHFHMQAKERLDWLEADQWADVNAAGSGTYRVYRFDDASTTGTLRGLRINKAASPSEYYWLGYRRALSDNPWLQSGAYLVWERPNNNRGWLLDTTPGSADGREDGMVTLGRTYSDTTAGVHITTVATGGSAPDEWIDVTVNLGSFPGNYDPTATLNAPATANARELVTFSVSAEDQDGDTLAYHWDFGDGIVEANTANQTRSWSVGGTYTVSVTVSDMKGGTVTKSQLITVSDPLDNWTQRTSGTSDDLYDIATDGSQLVAVGYEAFTGSYHRSSDGMTWTSGDIEANMIPRAIVWDGVSQFLVAGQEYDFSAPAGWYGVIYTSPDGMSWTLRNFGGARLRDIASSGSVHVAVGDGGAIWRSTDGVNWGPVASGTTIDLDGVSYGGGKFVAVGSDSGGGPAVSLNSTDGTSWADNSAGVGTADWQGFYDVEYCNDRFLASGWYSKIRHSTDGGTTFSTTRTTTEQVPAFTYGNGIYFAAGEDTTDFSVSYIQNLISVDGETWTPLTTETNQTERNAAVFFNDTFITVAEDGQIWQSDSFSAPSGGGAFATWIEGYFPGADPLAVALLDPDGDGASTLQEYASGTDPTDGSSVDLPQIDDSGTYVTLTVKKNPAATDVTYGVEISGDLAGWSSSGTVVVTDDATSLVVRSVLATGAAGALRQYLRAVYTLN